MLNNDEAGKSVTFKGEDLTKEFESAYESLEHGDYYNFGEKLGAALTHESKNLFLY